ncbi:hypothetical protein ACQKND_16095 [Viridibacillus arvi]|uniref:hypothetical protein n=1 Tax=Viridibacillus arvi TaxID=263475 RepID=UPI003CFD2BE2
MSEKDCHLSIRLKYEEDAMLIDYLNNLPRKTKSKIVRNMLSFAQQQVGVDFLTGNIHMKTDMDSTGLQAEIEQIKKTQEQQFKLIMSKLENLHVQPLSGIQEEEQITEEDEAVSDSAEAFMLAFGGV